MGNIKRLYYDNDGALGQTCKSDSNTQPKDETQRDFLSNNGGVIYSVSQDIQYLNQALVLLDIELEKKNLGDLALYIVGGYASYDLTNNGTQDVDSLIKLNHNIKEIVDDISKNRDLHLQSRWLNDEVLNLSSFSDVITKRMLTHLTTHLDEFIPIRDNLPTLKHLKLFKAKPEALAVMKLAAIISRSKDKDRDDLVKICRAMKWDASFLWDLLDRYKVQQFVEKEEFASILFTVGVIENIDEYVKFIG